MKKLILLSSALLGVVFLAGCGQQPARQTQSTTPAPAAEQPTVNQTANWKTYTSEKYGFSFQYPNDWKLSENSGNNSDRSVATIVSPETQKLAQDKQVIYSEDISIYYYPSISDGDENATKNLGATTLEELINKDATITKIGSTEIGGKEATDVLWGGMGLYYAILVTNDSHLYKIWFSNIDNKDNLTSIEKTILSTFKFTNQKEVVTADTTKTTTAGKKEPTEPLTYLIGDISASVSKETVPSGYTADQLVSMAQECGNKQTVNYFSNLVSKFSGATKTVYNFKYAGASQKSDTFVVTLLPNKAGYSSLDDFKKDFDQCYAGGDAYPKMLNDDWLLFVNSCGSGFNDGSGEPIGCQEVKNVVEPTLKLN